MSGEPWAFDYRLEPGSVVELARACGLRAAVEPLGAGWDFATFVCDGHVLRIPKRADTAEALRRELTLLCALPTDLPLRTPRPRRELVRVPHILVDDGDAVAVVDWADAVVTAWWVDFVGLWLWGGDACLEAASQAYGATLSDGEHAHLRRRALMAALDEADYRHEVGGRRSGAEIAADLRRLL